MSPSDKRIRDTGKRGVQEKEEAHRRRKRCTYPVLLRTPKRLLDRGVGLVTTVCDLREYGHEQRRQGLERLWGTVSMSTITRALPFAAQASGQGNPTGPTPPLRVR